LCSLRYTKVIFFSDLVVRRGRSSVAVVNSHLDHFTAEVLRFVSVAASSAPTPKCSPGSLLDRFTNAAISRLMITVIAALAIKFGTQIASLIAPFQRAR
jgi:hypothetical protein